MSERTGALTANQVVALNLYWARRHHGWTQEEAAERLEPYLGTRWSKATFSAAERSADPDATRVRQFSADDLLAFAQAFELPVWWFFLPPFDERVTTNPGHAGLSPGEALDAVFAKPGDVELFRLVQDRLPGGLEGSAYAHIYDQVLTLVLAAIGRAVEDVGVTADQVRALGDLIDKANEAAAEQAVADVLQDLPGEGSA